MNGAHPGWSIAIGLIYRIAAVENVVLNEKMKREADRLLAQIICADSLIVAVKAGARAEGFVLGMETVGALRAGEAENLYVIFENALEVRLKYLELV